MIHQYGVPTAIGGIGLLANDFLQIKISPRFFDQLQSD
jgi:hypothetical protein